MNTDLIAILTSGPNNAFIDFIEYTIMHKMVASNFCTKIHNAMHHGKISLTAISSIIVYFQMFASYKL